MNRFITKTPIDELDKNGWMVPSHNGYVEFPQRDYTGISVAFWNHIIPVKLHRHNFHEFALVTKGSCIHEYKETKVPLIPGDVFLIAPHEEHGYQMQAPLELINCQFFPEELSAECNQAITDAKADAQIIYDRYGLSQRWDDLVQNITELDGAGENHQSHQNSLNKQGVIHLEIEERREIEYLLQRMMREQEHQEDGTEYVKSACLQMILVAFQRVRKRQIQHAAGHPDTKKEFIYQALTYMEEHLSEKLDLDELAKNSYWSKSHFRAVFKDVTGLSPVGYLNRLRIVKSLEYMGKEHLNISQAAERVGIYDPSYYSRLFKKVMGYSPKHFKDIPE